MCPAHMYSAFYQHWTKVTDHPVPNIQSSVSSGNITSRFSKRILETKYFWKSNISHKKTSGGRAVVSSDVSFDVVSKSPTRWSIAVLSTTPPSSLTSFDVLRFFFQVKSTKFRVFIYLQMLRHRKTYYVSSRSQNEVTTVSYSIFRLIIYSA